MAALTGVQGSFSFRGGSACIRSWTINVSKEALDASCLGKYDREYVPGIRGASGTADVILDPNTGSGALLNSIFENIDEVTDTAVFTASTNDGKAISGDAFVTSVNHTVSVGSVQVANVSFQLTGELSGNF